MSQDHGLVMVVGSRGMLGTDLCSALEKNSFSWTGVDLPEVNIVETDSIRSAVASSKPSVIINAAAVTDVDGCETDQELAYRVNATGALNVARVARESGSFLIHLSTDYVFDGTKATPYVESDPVNPLGTYGRTKAEGERMILSEAPENSLIVRTQWLYGINGKNFVESILRACRERDVLQVVNDQHGRPTFTEDLSQALVELVRLRPKGVLHVANSGETTWHGFAAAIVSLEGLTHVRVQELTTAELNRPAPRPLNSVLDLRRSQAIAGLNLRNWKDALKVYLGLRRVLKG